MAVRDNTKAGNSVKQTSSVLHIRGCVHLPLQQVLKIIIFPDSAFYKLHSDIYFAKVLSLAMLVRTIFRKTLLKVYSTLKCLVCRKLKPGHISETFKKQNNSNKTTSLNLYNYQFMLINYLNLFHINCNDFSCRF